MYPLDMSNAAIGGYAVANDEAEHKALSACGYEPAFVGVAAPVPVPAPVAPADADNTAERLRAKLDAAGIEYDKRWGIARLSAALEGVA